MSSVQLNLYQNLMLFSYILNRGWIDRSSKRLPTYKEITGSGKGKQRAQDDDSAVDSEGGEALGGEDDEEFEDVADLFETSYNFRFEEP